MSLESQYDDIQMCGGVEANLLSLIIKFRYRRKRAGVAQLI